MSLFKPLFISSYLSNGVHVVEGLVNIDLDLFFKLLQTVTGLVLAWVFRITTRLILERFLSVCLSVNHINLDLLLFFYVKVWIINELTFSFAITTVFDCPIRSDNLHLLCIRLDWALVWTLLWVMWFWCIILECHFGLFVL